MNEAAIIEVFRDETFVKGLFAMETPEEVQKAMSGKGIELTVEQIVKIKELIIKKLDTGRELSEEELEDVTGGGILVLGLTLAALSLAVGVLGGGLAVGTTVGAAWLTDTLTNHTW